jgi:hypothetical protein
VNDTTIQFTYQIGNGGAEFTQGSDDYVKPLPNLTVTANTSIDKTIDITCNNPGHLIIGLSSNSSEFQGYVISIV